MTDLGELSVETQGVDVRKRFEGLKKGSEGAQGFDVGPVIVVAVILLITVIGAWVLQRRAWRARLQTDRRLRREDQERRRRHLEKEARQRRFTLVESREQEAFAVTCAATDISDIRAGGEGSLIAREPGHVSASVLVIGADDDGLWLAPRPEETGYVPDGEVWLAVRQAGARRLYPVVATRRSTGEHQDAMVVRPTGCGWKFSQLGRCDVDLAGVALPVPGSAPPREADATPIRVSSIGFGGAEIHGAVPFNGGTRIALRVALPDEMESVELAARVRAPSRAQDGRKITDVAFDVIPRPNRDILARALVRMLDESPLPEPVQTDASAAPRL